MRGDDTAIATGAHQEAAAETRGNGSDVIVVAVLNLFSAAREGQIHIHPRIAIGNGKDVKLIDFRIMIVEVIGTR